MKTAKECFEETLNENVQANGKSFAWAVKFPSVDKRDRWMKLALDATDAKDIGKWDPKTKKKDSDDSKNLAVGWWQSESTAKQLIKQAKEDFGAKRISK